MPTYSNIESHADTSLIGRQGTIVATDALTLQAGHDLILHGANLTAGANAATPGAVTLVATRDITIAEGREQHDDSRSVQSQRGSLISGSSTNDARDTRANLGVASTLSGDTVQVQAGRDLTIQGSEIVGTQDVTLTAGRQLQITAAQNQIDTASHADKTDNGFFSNGGLSVSLGTRTQAEQQTRSETTATGSLIGALHGDLTLTAGNDLHITGSTLYAGHDINLTGQTVTLDAAYDTVKQTERQQQRQAGLTLGLTSPVIAAVQTARQMAQSAQQLNGDARLTALAAATAGLAAKNAYDAVGGDLSSTKNLSLNLSLGESHSQSQAQTQTHTAQGSTVTAGSNVTLTAAGDPASRIDVIGSTLKAGQDLRLAAAGQINLQAAQTTRDSHSTNDGSSAQVGIALSAGTQTGLVLTAGAANQQGHTDEIATTWTNTHLTANRTLTLQSGGDTTLQGAVASAKQVIADIGGDLKLTSLQNTDHSDGQQQSAGLNVSVCVLPLCVGPSSLSAHADQTKVNGDTVSVGEQTGIKAGKDGFQIKVKGKTDLTGSVIASSQSAIDADKNRFESQGPVTQRDLNNTEHYDGKAVGISASNDASQLVGVGVGHAEGDQHSVTRSGIGVATETDTTGALKPSFDAQQVQHELNAQVAITQAFSQQASTAVGRYAADQLRKAQEQQTQALQKQAQADAALAQGDAARAAALQQEATALQQNADDIRNLWGDQGKERIAAHAIVGGLTGGVNGALGASTASATAPSIAAQIDQLDLPKSVKQALLAASTTTLGAALGGTAGAAAALAETANNYLTTQQEVQLDKALAACKTLACTAGTQLKYVAISAGQDAALLTGIGGGIGYQGAEQAAAMAELVTHLPETLIALKAIVNDEQVQQKVGAAVIADYQQRIDMLTRAYNDGGFDGSVTAGVEAGRLAVDIVSLGTAAAGVTKMVALTAKAGAGVVAAGVARLGVGAAEVAAGAKGIAPITVENFFNGARYTPKVLQQSSSGDFHAFPQSVDGFARRGTVTPIIGGDGITRMKLEIPGEYQGRVGVFEYIRNPDGTINHRLFVPKVGQ